MLFPLPRRRFCAARLHGCRRLHEDGNGCGGTKRQTMERADGHGRSD
jgi:hypothetical protein